MFGNTQEVQVGSVVDERHSASGVQYPAGAYCVEQRGLK
jgi:hypothetical protein